MRKLRAAYTGEGRGGERVGRGERVAGMVI